MKIKILGIKDAGNLEGERIILIAEEDVDLGDYMTCYVKETSKTTISTDIQSPFWFTNAKVKKGDRVVVYTREGERGRKVGNNGSTLYFYYRNHKEPLCRDATIGGIVLEVNDWNFESKRF